MRCGGDSDSGVGGKGETGCGRVMVMVGVMVVVTGLSEGRRRQEGIDDGGESGGDAEDEANSWRRKDGDNGGDYGDMVVTEEREWYGVNGYSLA